MLIKANKYKGYTGLREKEVLLVKTGAQRVRELLGQALATEKNRRKILFKYFFKNRQFLVVKTHKMSAGENSNIRGFSWQYGVSSPELGGEDSNPQRQGQNLLCCLLHHPRRFHNPSRSTEGLKLGGGVS